ncbi:MAG: RNA-protein complex protein Nop10 [Zestosphaera sp.]
MKFLMRKCLNCGRYTLKEVCPVCGSRTVCPHPPRFSPKDKYVRYRVLAKYSSSEGSSESS